MDIQLLYIQVSVVYIEFCMLFCSLNLGVYIKKDVVKHIFSLIQTEV